MEVRKRSIAEFEEEMSDVTFLVGPEKTKVAGFRQVLALSNTIFRKMFFGKFKDETEIEISEFEAEHFRIFLNYLYYQEIDLKQCDPFEIYMISHKYLVTTLCFMCAEEIVKKISLEDIFNDIEWNQMYNDEIISHKTNNFVKENTIACLTFKKGFAGLSKKSIADLLKLDYLKCSDEFLFENLLIWAEEQLRNEENELTTSNIKEMIADLLPFFHMEIKDDLTYAPNYITSRYNWPRQRRYKLVQNDSVFWKCRLNWTSRKIVFGFSISFDNFDSNSSSQTEKFAITVQYDGPSGALQFYEEEFEVTYRDIFVVKNIYLRKPLVCLGDFGFNIKFNTSKVRLLIGEGIFMLYENFFPDIHNIFVS